MGLEEFGASAPSNSTAKNSNNVAERVHNLALPPKEIYGVSEDEIPAAECPYRMIKRYPGDGRTVAVYCRLRHEFLIRNFVKLCVPSVCPIKQMFESVVNASSPR